MCYSEGLTMKAIALFWCLGVASAATARGDETRRNSEELDRHRFPPALQKVPFEHLSSGALRLLDRNGDLIQWPGLRTDSGPGSKGAGLLGDPSIVAGLD